MKNYGSKAEYLLDIQIANILDRKPYILSFENHKRIVKK